jgi:hypothetical protein
MRRYEISYRHTGFTVPNHLDRVRVPQTWEDETTIDTPDTAKLLPSGAPNAALARRIEEACWHPGCSIDDIDPDTATLCDDYEWVTGFEITAITEVPHRYTI